MNTPIAEPLAPAATRRCIRDTGREFCQEFSCAADPAAANEAARRFADQIDFMRGPVVKQAGAGAWTVTWYGLD